MLQEDIKTPVLYFAMDQLAIPSVDTYGALSIENAKMLEAEQLKKEAFVEKANLTDIFQYLSRIPIPINDRILPVHYTGGLSQQDHFVDYLSGEAILSKANNMVSLRFELKSSLSALSTVTDVILSLATVDFFASNQPRISFFSMNLCIFNAYLRGISRGVVSDTDMEVVTINLEIAPNRLELDVIEGKSSETSSSLADLSQNLSPEDFTTNGSYNQISFEEINFEFTWYQFMAGEDIDAVEVPDFYPKFTIEREDVRFMRVVSNDFDSIIRRQMTVEYKNEYITLKAGDGQILGENYGLMMYADNLFFGVRDAN